MSTALDIVSQYNEQTHNLLVPIKTVAEIAEIQKPVMNVVYISTNLEDKEIYIQEKESKGHYDNDRNWVSKYEPAKYALAKNGLNKLANAAGIDKPETRPVLPSTCQKCIAINRGIGTAVKCGECKNKDVKFMAKISVPQLTGENIEYVAHKEICIETDTIGMSENQKAQYIKFRSETCETKAINRALRAALLIKPTYLLEELKKPFVVAFLVPNLNDPDVKAAWIQKYSQSVSHVFGSKVPQSKIVTIPYDEDVFSDFSGNDDLQSRNNDTDTATIQEEKSDQQVQQQAVIYICVRCKKNIPQNVYNYSTKHYGNPLCYSCQKNESKVTRR